MNLRDLFEGLSGVSFPSSQEHVSISAVWDDSRRVTKGSLFAAFSGVNQNGEAFIESAIKRGANAVLLSKTHAQSWKDRYPDVCFINAEDPKACFQRLVGRFYDHPSRKLKVIGITGTNGKTTITYLLESIIQAAGKKSGVVGTVNYRVGSHVLPSKNTTPGFLDNQIFLSGLVKENVPYAVMEVSSHALAQGRVENIHFHGGIFTNLTGDHLDFHKTMDSYFEAKSKLFSTLSLDSYAVVNLDDIYGKKLLPQTRAQVISYAIKNTADIRAEVKEFGPKGTRFVIRFFKEQIEIQTSFIGHHNIHNILASFACGLAEGFSPEVIKKGIESLAFVPGRLERVDCGQDFHVFIDYAHTDDGLKNVLEALTAIKRERVIVVFGAGGDRDRTKRPRMGKIACDLADHSIVTSDNPRSENPEQIISEIVAGYSKKNYECITDRREAIARAMEVARSGDIILLAGKGHETYQVLKDRTIDFNEKDIVTESLSQQGKTVSA